MGPVDLAAEVISLGGRNRDRVEKRDLYEQHGVKEYWLIDSEPETVEVLAMRDAAYAIDGRYHRGDVARSVLLPGFEMDVNELLGERPVE